MPFTNPYIAKIADLQDLIIQPPKDNLTTQKWPVKFALARDLVLDIGCGSGNFLIQMAQANPNFNFVGIELKYKRLFKAAQKTLNAKLDNVKLIKTRAENIQFFFKASSVAAVFINFPDPWPKKRHQKKRLMTADYAKIIKNILKPSGLLFFQTDHLDYFNQANKNLQTCGFDNFEKRDFCQLGLNITDNKDRVFLSEFGSLFLSKKSPNLILMLKK